MAIMVVAARPPAMPQTLFPFYEYWWLYACFTAFVAALLSVDLGIFHRDAHAVSLREAGLWTAIWIALAAAFSYGVYRFALWTFTADPALLAQPGFNAAAKARQIWLEFLAGYTVEESLSVDNLFVFVLVFRYFTVPAEYQHRLLFYGVLGAVVLRAAFIAVGSALIQYHWVVYLFGAFLLFTGGRMLWGGGEQVSLEDNLALRLIRKRVPITKELHGRKFVVRFDRKWMATPLFVTLALLEVTDIAFAVDSVPAIFGVTREPLVVFTSNIFAILGLRSMYFLLAGAVDKFHLLRYGLALVLIFVGLKMTLLDRWMGGEFPIWLSLAVILGTVGAAIGLSLAIPPRPEPHP